MSEEVKVSKADLKAKIKKLREQQAQEISEEGKRELEEKISGLKAKLFASFPKMRGKGKNHACKM